MPEMTPLGNTGNTPAQMFEPINQILGVRQKQQALQIQAQQLQTGQYTQQQEQAAAQTAQRVAGEQQRLSQIPWHSFENEDGSLDTDKATKAALAVGGGSAPEFVKRLTDMSIGAADSKKAFNGLSKDLQDQARSVFGSWAGSDTASLNELETQAKLLVENTPQNSRGAMQKIVDHALIAVKGPNLVQGTPKNPQEQKQTALGFSQAGLDQAAISGAGGISSPEGVTLPAGQMGKRNRQTGLLSEAPTADQGPPKPAAPAAPGTPPQTAPPRRPINPTGVEVAAARETATGTAAEDNKRNDLISASVAPSRQAITLTDQIAKLSDEVKTGKYSKAVADYQAAFHIDNPEAAARQLMGKYAKQLQAVASSGATTNEARETINGGMPDPDTMAPEAIRGAAEFIKGTQLMNLSRAANARKYAETHKGTQGLRGADDTLMSIADPHMYTYQNLPKGPERTDYIKRHFKTNEEKNEFIRRKNQVEHYGGFEQQ